MADRIDRARALRAMIEANAQTMEPERAVEYPELFPEWNGDGRMCAAGEIYRRNGELVKVLQDHVSQPDWTPENAPSLFAKLLTDPTGETIKPWERPDSTNGYKFGDKVTHIGFIWENTLQNMPNTWEPGAIGTEALWKKLSEYTG